jgi:23S rRNA pseudouridine1911/1915/1917 synthase
MAVFTDPAIGKHAVTHYRVLERIGYVTLVECILETGRTHQIRVHMAGLGCPVIGDRVYGKSPLDRKISPFPARQMLHAWRLSLRHPVSGGRIFLEAPVPDDMLPYFSALPGDGGK